MAGNLSFILLRSMRPTRSESCAPSYDPMPMVTSKRPDVLDQVALSWYSTDLRALIRRLFSRGDIVVIVSAKAIVLLKSSSVMDG